MEATTIYRTPGQLVAALLEQRGWSQAILAAVLDLSPTIITRIVNNQRAVDAETALALGEVFGVSPKRFLILQGQYDLAKAKIEKVPDPDRAVRAQLYSDLPVAEMVRRAWIDVPDVNDVRAVEKALMHFFRAPTPDQIEVLPHAAKKTVSEGAATPVQLAWLYRVIQIARRMVAPRFSTKGMQVAIKKMQALLASPEEARKAPRILHDAGVRYLLVESLPGAKVDGVCCWLDERTPVIAMTTRLNRIDNFWFVLRHECEHVLRGDGRAYAVLDTDMETAPDRIVSDEEQAANDAAAEFCVPQTKLKQFIARKDPIFTERDLTAFAKLVNVHPGLVAGQLQRATERYDRFRSHLVKVRDIVLPNVMHDGWGDVAPVVEPFTPDRSE
ncbi:MAG: HigA family addiction module antitoxin [Longimicrobiales bacterium]